jgi:hypothetical protein
MTAGAHLKHLSPQAVVEPSRATKKLEILSLRSLELAERVAAGEIALLDAVDMAYGAAVWAGLTETVGDDIVQTILAEAFRK